MKPGAGAEVRKVRAIQVGSRDVGVYQLRACGVVLAEVTNGRGEPEWMGRAASEICRRNAADVEAARRIMREVRR
jgi:hypothetical protein